MPPSRTWSLAEELGTIELAVDGVALLVDQIEECHGDDLPIAKKLAHDAGATATLVHLRLRDLGRVLRGELDPGALAAPHNIAPPEGASVNHGMDVFFGPRGANPPNQLARRSSR